MRNEKQQGLAGFLLMLLILTGASSMLSACSTVAGAGQDVSTVGNGYYRSGADKESHRSPVRDL